METTEKQGNALAGTGVGLGAGALGLLLLQNGGLGGDGRVRTLCPGGKGCRAQEKKRAAKG